MDPCEGCYTKSKAEEIGVNDACGIITVSKEYQCPCQHCLIKPMCKTQCATFLIFLVKNGLMTEEERSYWRSKT